MAARSNRCATSCSIFRVWLERISVVRHCWSKALLKAHRAGAWHLAFSEHVIDQGPQVFDASGKAGFEGIVSKQVDAPYVNTRARSWVKVKHEDTDEFVIVGYTAPRGSRVGFGSLLLATPDKGGLRYVGRVGTGFDDESLRAAQGIAAAGGEDARAAAAGACALPRCQRALGEAGDGGRGGLPWLGQGRPAAPGQFQAAAQRQAEGGPGMSTAVAKPEARSDHHPERVVFPRQKLRKGDVADYYRRMARWILPEIAGRPLSLLRCPDGVGKACFFQKHHGPGLGDAVHAVPCSRRAAARTTSISTMRGACCSWCR
jgi:bifunctional non-homologous end joining protein LigD